MGRSCKHTCSTEKRRCHFGVNIQSGLQSEPGQEAEAAVHAAVVAGTVGKVLGTFLLICVITGAILLCFAAVYIKTVIIRRPIWRPISS